MRWILWTGEKTKSIKTKFKKGGWRGYSIMGDVAPPPPGTIVVTETAQPCNKNRQNPSSVASFQALGKESHGWEEVGKCVDMRYVLRYVFCQRSSHWSVPQDMMFRFKVVVMIIFTILSAQYVSPAVQKGKSKFWLYKRRVKSPSPTKHLHHS